MKTGRPLHCIAMPTAGGRIMIGTTDDRRPRTRVLPCATRRTHTRLQRYDVTGIKPQANDSGPTLDNARRLWRPTMLARSGETRRSAIEGFPAAACCYVTFLLSRSVCSGRASHVRGPSSSPSSPPRLAATIILKLVCRELRYMGMTVVYLLVWVHLALCQAPAPAPWLRLAPEMLEQKASCCLGMYSLTGEGAPLNPAVRAHV